MLGVRVACAPGIPVLLESDLRDKFGTVRTHIRSGGSIDLKLLG